MDHSVEFCVVSFEAHPARAERLNVGLAIFHADYIEVEVSEKLDKVRAISGLVSAELIRTLLSSLTEMDEFARLEGAVSANERVELMRPLTSLKLGKVSNLSLRSAKDTGATIQNLMSVYVNPEFAPLIPRPKRTRLARELRGLFAGSRVLAMPQETVHSHRILENYRLAEGLSADFLLKNGKYHIIETVDISHEGISSKKVVQEVAVAALVVEQARLSLSDGDIAPTIIYKAVESIERVAKSALLAAENQGARLLNWESKEDRVRFVSSIIGLAEPLPSIGDTNLAQQFRFKIN